MPAMTSRRCPLNLHQSRRQAASRPRIFDHAPAAATIMAATLPWYALTTAALDSPPIRRRHVPIIDARRVGTSAVECRPRALRRSRLFPVEGRFRNTSRMHGLANRGWRYGVEGVPALDLDATEALCPTRMPTAVAPPWLERARFSFPGACGFRSVPHRSSRREVHMTKAALLLIELQDEVLESERYAQRRSTQTCRDCWRLHASS